MWLQKCCQLAISIHFIKKTMGRKRTFHHNLPMYNTFNGWGTPKSSTVSKGFHSDKTDMILDQRHVRVHTPGSMSMRTQRGQSSISFLVPPFNQWPFQDPKLEVPTTCIYIYISIYKLNVRAKFRGYTPNFHGLKKPVHDLHPGPRWPKEPEGSGSRPFVDME